MGLLLPLSRVREIAYFLFPTCFSSFLMFPISLPLSFLCSSFFAFHPYYFPLFLALALFLFSYCFLELSAENWWLWLVDQFTAIDMWVWVQWGIWQSLLLPTCWQDGEIWLDAGQLCEFTAGWAAVPKGPWLMHGRQPSGRSQWCL